MKGKKNWKGIEYEYENYHRIIKYEGLNGKRNGKGKEYICEINNNNSYQFIFEGEYFNNYRLRGKEYYEIGNLKFEGEILFKEKYDIKIYDYNGNILFENIDDNARIEDNNKNIKLFIA